MKPGRWVAKYGDSEVATSPAAANLKLAKCRFAANFLVLAEMVSCAVEDNLHTVEQLPAKGTGTVAQFISIRGPRRLRSA